MIVNNLLLKLSNPIQSPLDVKGLDNGVFGNHFIVSKISFHL